MNKKFILVMVLLIALFSSANLYAQNDTAIKPPVYKVGIFAPLYLDSVFTNSQLRNDKSLPKFIMPPVDFVQGAGNLFLAS